MTVTCAILAGDLTAEGLRVLFTDGWQTVLQWIVEGYQRAPVLMAGLGIVAATPLLALTGLVVGRLSARPLAPEPIPMATEKANAQGLGWPRDAWIAVEGSAERPQSLPRELLSIGREDDNDLRLEHATVHRHHAVLRRTPEAQFIIQDLSGEAGNGVKVNGRRVEQAYLADGDRIEVGAVRLMFAAQPA